MKLAKVLPIDKNDDEQLIQNYRPISVHPFYSKIFEKVIYNNILQFIETNNILYDKQFGFRKRHSTNHAIIALVEKVADTGVLFHLSHFICFQAGSVYHAENELNALRETTLTLTMTVTAAASTMRWNPAMKNTRKSMKKFWSVRLYYTF